MQWAGLRDALNSAAGLLLCPKQPHRPLAPNVIPAGELGHRRDGARVLPVGRGPRPSAGRAVIPLERSRSAPTTPSPPAPSPPDPPRCRSRPSPAPSASRCGWPAARRGAPLHVRDAGDVPHADDAHHAAQHLAAAVAGGVAQQAQDVAAAELGKGRVAAQGRPSIWPASDRRWHWPPTAPLTCPRTGSTRPPPCPADTSDSVSLCLCGDSALRLGKSHAKSRPPCPHSTPRPGTRCPPGCPTNSTAPPAPRTRRNPRPSC